MELVSHPTSDSEKPVDISINNTYSSIKRKPVTEIANPSWTRRASRTASRPASQMRLAWAIRTASASPEKNASVGLVVWDMAKSVVEELFVRDGWTQCSIRRRSCDIVILQGWLVLQWLLHTRIQS